MKDSLTISFTCSTNTAVLLMTLYEILSRDTPIDTSVLVPDNFAWLVDEIAARAEEALEAKVNIDGETFQEGTAAMAMVEFEQKRHQRILDKPTIG